MKNLVVMAISLILYFSIAVICFKKGKKEGAFAFISFASVMATVETCISIDLLGFTCTLGTVAFASIFLSVDMINETYGKKTAQKASIMAGFVMLMSSVASCVNSFFVPSEYDFAFDSYINLFGFVPRMSISSVICFTIAEIFNCKIFNFIKSRTGTKKMWIRNNVSTIITNCSENFLFYFLAFLGEMKISEIVSCALTATVLEVIVALLDTPFLYIAVKNKKIKTGVI